MSRSAVETRRPPAPRRLISGGQTGVDRAALDFALSCGIPCGGWCPAGRWAEDGPIAAEYPLRETPSSDPAQRTAWNVRDSDATLVLHRSRPQGGTARTVADAQRLARPWLSVDLDSADDLEPIRGWLHHLNPVCLNVAGPRESEAPGIYDQALHFLHRLFSRTE